MDWSRVPVFLKVVETESITRAAELLRLPKSSVSRTVAALERELEAQLLVRTTRHVKLTDAGRQFYERARAARSALEEAAAHVEHRADDAEGVVRVTVAPNGWPLADLFTRFTKLHPKVHVEVVATNRMVNLVEEGIDLAIRAGTLVDSTLIARRLSTADLGLFATKAYLARKGTPQRVEELNEHEVVLFRAKNGAGTLRLIGPKDELELAVRGRVSADDLGFVHAFIQLDGGIGLLPLVMGLEDRNARHGGLVRVLPEYRVKGSGLHLVMPAARYVPTRVRLLSDFIAANLDEHQLCNKARDLTLGVTGSGTTPRATAASSTPSPRAPRRPPPPATSSASPRRRRPSAAATSAARAPRNTSQASSSPKS